MRSFPDQFPIRYAIIAHSRLSSDQKDPIGREKIAKVLWEQLVVFLQSNQLTPDNLNLNYQKIGYDYSGTNLCKIPVLNFDPQKAKSLVKEMRSYIPLGVFSSGFGTAFSLGLVSYEGALDTPLFWKIISRAKDKKYVGEGLGLYNLDYYNFESLAKGLEEQYKQIMEGGIMEIERMRAVSELTTSEILIPNSELWEALRAGFNDGYIPPLADNFSFEPPKTVGSDKIKITLAKSIKDLFLEEMLALYRTSSFCNNCGKPLPFYFTGRYCNSLECKKDRARKRSRKSSSQKRH